MCRYVALIKFVQRCKSLSEVFNALKYPSMPRTSCWTSFWMSDPKKPVTCLSLFERFLLSYTSALFYFWIPSFPSCHTFHYCSNLSPPLSFLSPVDVSLWLSITAQTHTNTLNQSRSSIIEVTERSCAMPNSLQHDYRQQVLGKFDTKSWTWWIWPSSHLEQTPPSVVRPPFWIRSWNVSRLWLQYGKGLFLLYSVTVFNVACIKYTV